MRIKREHWGRQYRLVARDDHGRLLSHTRYSPKTSKMLRDRFKANLTFRDDIRIRTYELTNVREYTVEPLKEEGVKEAKSIARRKRRAQVSLTAYVDGEAVHARSSFIGEAASRDLDSAYEEALDRLGERVSGKYLDKSDADSGISYLKERGIKVEYRVVYYTRK